MFIQLFFTLLYAVFHIHFARSVRLGKLGFKNCNLRIKQNPIQYLLAYFISVAALGFLLITLIELSLNMAMLPTHYSDNLDKASALQLKQLNGDRPKITAHRGLAWQYPENTIISFKAAIKHQPDYVELDFRTTADGHLVCIHDQNLNRYLDGKHPDLHDKPIETLTLEQLQAVDFGSWKSKQFTGTPLATLSQVINLFNDLDQTTNRPILMLEHKTGTVDQLLNELSAFTDPSQYIVQSFDWIFLHQLHNKNPDIQLAAIGSGKMNPNIISKVKKFGCFAVHWNDEITAENIQLLHEHGLEAWCYTFNYPRQWRYAKQIGLDAITTDRCDELAGN